MKKEDLFSKINSKDYNNKLENILETKDFSEDVKNLLLSMFYKIENAYNDYSKVKKDVKPKKEFIENVSNIIQKKCDHIQIMKPKSDECLVLNNKNLLISKKQKKIVVYPTEPIILYALFSIAQKDILVDEKYDIIKNPLTIFLKHANSINNVEVIRDFNGWSWSTTIEEIDSIEYNIIYQFLQILVGNKFLEEWINSDKLGKDYFVELKNKLEKLYGKENCKEFIIGFETLLIMIDINENKSEEKRFKEILKTITQDLKLFENKTKFLQDITVKKKEASSNIKYLDKILNNRILLRREYEKRNENLKQEDKIFSLSHLEEKIISERKEYIDIIKDCNELMDPKRFVEKETQLRNNFKIISMAIDSTNIYTSTIRIY